MAKRELQEINAGSMADIAFLLLIFFLVTTTVEVDAGISRNLPFKKDPNDQPPPNIEIRDRDILEIYANKNDQLQVEGQLIEFDKLEETVRDFFTANVETETNKSMPAFKTIDRGVCQANIAQIEAALAEKPAGDEYLEGELEKWNTKLELCKTMGGSYREISKMAIIRLKNQAGTSYGLYIQIQNVLKKIVNEERQRYAQDVWGKDYFALDQSDLEDQKIIAALRILVPERIIEAPIDR